ncbi:protein FAM184A-like isoform X2 [Acipenser ruthenus]|uniref:protein FAM184A-like isoform X2 n=1 Tax=Acipenser ruthenus TaxID=7906 RepID=UPI002741FF6F|nr:protein FAM184A-like isoform X2 [Acipenser ruthenus]
MNQAAAGDLHRNLKNLIHNNLSMQCEKSADNLLIISIVKMATGTGWQQYYNSAGNSSTGAGKYNSATTSTMSYQTGLSMEYTPDLHLKISKKIAQLTKVIYALNTKNDEHEAAIQTLKEAHEEEVQQILSETREKILQYKSKVSDEVDLRRRIQSLEESMELHERMKRQAMAEFKTYRHRVEDMQLCTEAQHTQHVVTMSREVEEMRRSFEEKLRSFTQVQAQFEMEKRLALEELRSAHRQEIQELLRGYQSQNANYSKDQEKLEQLHKTEVDSLTEYVEELKMDKKKLVEEYEAKLTKAQAFYERELEAMKGTQQLTANNLLAWKKTEAELKKEFQAQEAALQKTLEKLRTELKVVQEEACESREKSQKLQSCLKTAENNIKGLQKQLDEATQNTGILMIEQKEMECELEATRDRVQQQATEILLKASHIGSLQAMQMTHEAAIRDLESEKSRLKDKLARLEEERGLLQSKSQSMDERQKQQILALEKALKEDKQSYEKEMVNIRAKYEEEAAQFKETQAKVLEELSKQHQATVETTQTTGEREKKMLQMEMEQQFEKERLSLEEQENRLRQQLENLREELTAKLSTANQEVSRLQELVKKSEQGLVSAEGHISSLKDAQEKLHNELDSTRARLRETSNSLTALQGEMDKQRQQHEARLISIKEEEKLKIDKVALELELKWTETLRQECKKLREELREDHEEDKKSIMTRLSQQKQQEMNAARESWQKKMEDLLDQRQNLGEALHKSISNISLLKQSLEMQLSQSQNSLHQLQAQFNQEREHLNQQLQEMEGEHQRQERSLEEAHCIDLHNMEEAKAQELKELDERLRLQHYEELHCLKEAHRQSIDTLKQQSEQELQTLRFELEDEGKAMLASLRSELNHLHASAIEHLRQTHQQETAAAKLELENALEQSRRQEKELLGRISELQEEVRHRENQITELDEEIHSLHENISTLTKELEYKGKEVLKIRSEANQQIRVHEQELNKKHEKELNEMTMVHVRETQNMLLDFNKAQELLKDKITALQILLEGAEEKFRNRESRPEDLQFIAELKDMVTERESLVKKLIDDKKFYQLELVNRETNFNKVFNASPNVGVINPLVKQKKKNDKSANRFISAPNLSALEPAGTGHGPPQPTRLEPIPNSPIHDLEFNSSKPLPQPTPPKEPKKFLSPPEAEDPPVDSSDPQRQEWFARYFTF